MSAGTIVSAERGKTLPAKDNYPEKVVWKLKVRTPEGEKEADIFCLPTDPTPTGEVSLKPTDYGLRAFPPRRGGGGGMRQTHPEDARRMARCHSQEMALRYCQIQAMRGRLPDDFDIKQLKPIIDWFERDIA